MLQGLDRSADRQGPHADARPRDPVRPLETGSTLTIADRPRPGGQRTDRSAGFRVADHRRRPRSSSPDPREIARDPQDPPETGTEPERLEKSCEVYLEPSVAPELRPVPRQLASLKKQLMPGSSPRRPSRSSPSLAANGPAQDQDPAPEGTTSTSAQRSAEGVPEAIAPLPPGAPRDRLALARWLVSDDNPTDRPGRRQSLLGASLRHRAWSHQRGVRFARRTPDPPRIARLARDRAGLRSIGTSSNFLRLLVTSATYRQSSKVTPDGLRLDPANRWLARGPRFRLSAETVRDQALAVAGLLSPKDVRPARPAAPAVERPDRGVRRQDRLADQHGRRQVPAGHSTPPGDDRIPTPRWPPSTPPTARSAPSAGPGPTPRSRPSSRLNDPGLRRSLASPGAGG